MSAYYPEFDENTLLGEWLSYWLDTYVKPIAKPSSYEHYRDNCEKHIIPSLGEIPIGEISAKMLQRFFNGQARTGNLRDHGPLSTKSMRNMRVVLDVAFKQAVSEDVVSHNPVPLTAIKSCKTRRPEVMTDAMQEQLEQYLFHNRNIYHPGIILALYTGLRRGEVCALRWRNYNEVTGKLTVEQTVRRLTNYDAAPGEPKTRLVFNEVKTDSSDRILVMPMVVPDMLKEQKRRFIQQFHFPREDDFIIFSKNGGVTDPDNLQHYFSRLLRKLGLEHVKFHAIRHTFATRAIENGIDVSTVSGILGHADVTTTTHFYVRPREKAMNRAMQSITPIIQPPAQSTPPSLRRVQ